MLRQLIYAFLAMFFILPMIGCVPKVTIPPEAFAPLPNTSRASANDCTADAAYAAGFNDAKMNDAMRGNYDDTCPANLRSTLSKAYRKGYEVNATKFSNKRVNICVDCY